MVKEPIRSRGDTVGDAAITRATGRAPQEWFAALDAAGGAAWAHDRTVGWLAEQGVSPWWSQSLAAGYARARGLPRPT